jgi:hypothetical protein
MLLLSHNEIKLKKNDKFLIVEARKGIIYCY